MSSTGFSAPIHGSPSAVTPVLIEIAAAGNVIFQYGGNDRSVKTIPIAKLVKIGMLNLRFCHKNCKSCMSAGRSGPT